VAFRIVDPASEDAIGEEGRLRDALGVTAFGVFQVQLPPGTETTAHDHTTDGAEDVYAVIEGSGWVVVDGDARPVRAGEFVFITPDSTRHMRAGPDGLTYIAVCG
jgi:quercetin dioxygenase-like cupin family protein